LVIRLITFEPLTLPLKRVFVFFFNQNLPIYLVSFPSEADSDKDLFTSEEDWDTVEERSEATSSPSSNWQLLKGPVSSWFQMPIKCLLIFSIFIRGGNERSGAERWWLNG